MLIARPVCLLSSFSNQSLGQINFITADGTLFTHPLHHLGKSRSDLPVLAFDTFKHMFLFKKFANIHKPGKIEQFVADLHSGECSWVPTLSFAYKFYKGYGGIQREEGTEEGAIPTSAGLAQVNNELRLNPPLFRASPFVYLGKLHHDFHNPPPEQPEEEEGPSAAPPLPASLSSAASNPTFTTSTDTLPPGAPGEKKELLQDKVQRVIEEKKAASETAKEIRAQEKASVSG